VVSVPLVRSNQPMTASNTCRHSREPLACHIPRQGLTLGSDGHAIKLTRAKAAPLQRWLNGPDGRKLNPYRVSDFDDPASDLGCCRRKDIKTRRPAATQMQLSATLKEGQA
jgi:hypothetical protein